MLTPTITVAVNILNVIRNLPLQTNRVSVLRATFSFFFFDRSIWRGRWQTSVWTKNIYIYLINNKCKLLVAICNEE